MAEAGPEFEPSLDFRYSHVRFLSANPACSPRKERLQDDSLPNHPFILFAVSLVTLSLAAHAGVFVSTRRAALDDGARDDFGTILAAALTLLGLIIGFSFSMAISRYDLRKTYEEAEANAIGTEYVRADLLPSAEAARVRALLKLHGAAHPVLRDNRRR